MDKNRALKILNPVLAALLVLQAASGFLYAALDLDFFEGLHIVNGLLLLGAAGLHLALNWSWVKAAYGRKGR